MSVDIQRIDASSTTRLRKLLHEGNRPFVITESIDAQSRETLWSPSSLRSRVDTREVSVTRSERGLFDYTDEGQPTYADVVLPFSEAMELIASSKAPGPCYYLRRTLLKELGLDNAEVLPRTFLLAGGAKRSARLWVSSQGSVTPLHYDTRNNLLTQMHGSKLVTLFPSSEHERMYPMAFTGTNLLSVVDPEAVDESSFPNFPGDLKLTVEFNPGDTLFIPPFWWHHVRSREFSISVNVFWQLRPEQCLVPNSIEYLRVMYKRNGLADLIADDGNADRLRFAELAARAHELGLNGAATLFCAASARMTLQATSRSRAEAVSAGNHGKAGSRLDQSSGGERTRLEHLILLGGLVAMNGKTPTASTVGEMVTEVFRFATQA